MSWNCSACMFVPAPEADVKKHRSRLSLNVCHSRTAHRSEEKFKQSLGLALVNGIGPLTTGEPDFCSALIMRIFGYDSHQKVLLFKTAWA